MVIRQVLEQLHLEAISIELGEIEFPSDLDQESLKALQDKITPLGFELINDKRSRLIESIKNAIIKLVHSEDQIIDIKLSSYLSDQLHYDYNHLSQLFSSVEGITVEHYFIQQKIEKVKELLVYDELSLTEIAYRLGYSSLAHLSSQFKKVTGLTPSHFKKLRDSKIRQPLDKLNNSTTT